MSKLESRITEQFSTFFDDEDIITMTPFESTFPFVSRLVGSPSQARNLISFLRQETSDIRQIIAFSLLGYTIPMLGNSIRRKFTKLDQVQYKKTKIYHLLNHISQGFKLGAVTTLIETISEMVLGLDASISVVMTNAVSSILFSIWGMFRVKFVKNLALKYYFKRINIESLRVKRLYENISDVLLYLITSIIALDTLGFKYQTALKSISVFGGVGTIVFSLASKDMSTQMLSGMSIQLTQQYEEGDEVILETGEQGIISNIGPLHTYLRGDDEILVKISNAEMERLRISNLSLGSTSQVKQKLRFDYSAIENASELVDAIKKEIKEESKGIIILDGSRPFRVHWTSFGEEWLEITVDCRLRLIPLSDEYYDKRQEILEAIARAAKSCNARFAENLS